MFGHIATALVSAMTGRGREEGALKGNDIADALARLKQHQHQLGEAPAPDYDEADDDDEEEEPIDLSVRAVPLVEMLEAAAAKVEEGDLDTYVMWQPE